MARKPRNYRAEYVRRIANATKRGIPRSVARGHAGKGLVGIRAAKELGIEGYNIEKAVARDARRMFGRKPKRKAGEFPLEYEIKLGESINEEKEPRFPWTDEASFIATIMGAGMSEREAYTLWFSP